MAMDFYANLLPLCLLLLMHFDGNANAGTLTLPEGPPWHFWFKLPDSIDNKIEVLKLQFKSSKTQVTVTKANRYLLKYIVDVNGTQTEHDLRIPSKPKSLGITLDNSSIGIWLDQKNGEDGEVMALSPLKEGMNVKLDHEDEVQYSGQALAIEKNIDEIIMNKCFSLPITITSDIPQTVVTCPTQDLAPKDNIIATTILTEEQDYITTEMIDESGLQTSKNKSDRFSEGSPEVITFKPTAKSEELVTEGSLGEIMFKPTVKSEELITEDECSIPGYMWALLGLTSILAILFIPLLVYAIRISRRYHKVCIKLESWKNQGDSKLPPYLDMSQNTLRRPQPLQTHLISDVNSTCSNITPPHTPLSATESALSSHLFDTNSSTLPRGGLIRTASISSYTNSGVKTIDSNSGYSSLKRQGSSNSYTNPTITNTAQFSAPPPPPLEEMEEDTADHTKKIVETAKENNIFVL